MKSMIKWDNNFGLSTHGMWPEPSIISNRELLIKSAKSLTSAGGVDLSSEPTIQRVGILMFAELVVKSEAAAP